MKLSTNKMKLSMKSLSISIFFKKKCSETLNWNKTFCISLEISNQLDCGSAINISLWPQLATSPRTHASTFFFLSDNTGNEEDNDYVDPPTLNLTVLRAATRNFSAENKLGEGGFGEVFKVHFQLYIKQSLHFDTHT